MRPALTAIVLSLAALAGCRGDPVKCDQGCRNYFTLHFWAEADKELARAPADQRDALRKQKLGDLDKRMADGVDMCVSQCQAASNKDDIECMIAAKTVEQVRACANTWSK
jgi:hypothetical protein